MLLYRATNILVHVPHHVHRKGEKKGIHACTCTLHLLNYKSCCTSILSTLLQHRCKVH